MISPYYDSHVRYYTISITPFPYHHSVKDGIRNYMDAALVTKPFSNSDEVIFAVIAIVIVPMIVHYASAWQVMP